MPDLRLVSRRWHVVFWRQPSSWRTLTLEVHQPELYPEEREQWRASKCRRLHRLGGVATAKELSCWGWEEADDEAADAAVACLVQLQPGLISRVTLRWEAALPAAVLLALLRFSQELELLN